MFLPSSNKVKNFHKICIFLSGLSLFVPHAVANTSKSKNEIRRSDNLSAIRKGTAEILNESSIQINGKLRSKIEIDPSIDEKTLKDNVLGDSKVKKWIDGKAVSKWIIIPGKLVNIIIR